MARRVSGIPDCPSVGWPEDVLALGGRRSYASAAGLGRQGGAGLGRAVYCSA